MANAKGKGKPVTAAEAEIETERPPLAITMGEPAGIGGEIALLAWLTRREHALSPFLLLDDPARLRALGTTLGHDVPIREITAPAEATTVFDHALPVLPIPLPRAARPGHPDPENAPAVLASLAQAVSLAQAGSVSGLITNPIHKATLHSAGFSHPGHTEYLAALTGADRVAMMLASPLLRTVPVSTHMSLGKALASLNQALIIDAAELAVAALRRDFACAGARIALAGLNPHAGEGGAFGREDLEIIAPARARLVAQGIDARGPLPADAMFHPAARKTYDAAICMYHDQALIPIKTLDFFGAVNVTLGLPIVRTSPDHGVALDLAGRGLANADSLRAALKLAGRIAENRARADRGQRSTGTDTTAS